MCCGADDDTTFTSREQSKAYASSRMQYASLEAEWAGLFSQLDACVSDYDDSAETPEGVKNLLEAWEKVFNEILQAKSNVELLHHYAQVQRLASGLQMAVNTAFGAQYQQYHSVKPEFIHAPDAVNDAVKEVREAFSAPAGVPA